MSKKPEEQSQVEKEVTQKDEDKTCFLITPIGDEKSPVRRHIDGVIESAIEPVLKEFNYKLDVSHKSYNSGSIKSEIIKAIYESDLVIANLTYQNPNVMYEVAIRHCVAKPIIHISENINEIPFDINGHRTFNYVNDMHGVEALKKILRNAINEIESSDDISNPVIDSLKTTKIINIPSDSVSYEKFFPEILNSLKSLTEKVDFIEREKNRSVKYQMDSKLNNYDEIYKIYNGRMTVSNSDLMNRSWSEISEAIKFNDLNDAVLNEKNSLAEKNICKKDED